MPKVLTRTLEMAAVATAATITEADLSPFVIGCKSSNAQRV